MQLDNSLMPSPSKLLARKPEGSGTQSRKEPSTLISQRAWQPLVAFQLHAESERLVPTSTCNQTTVHVSYPQTSLVSGGRRDSPTVPINSTTSNDGEEYCILKQFSLQIVLSTTQQSYTSRVEQTYSTYRRYLLYSTLLFFFLSFIAKHAYHQNESEKSNK